MGDLYDDFNFRVKWDGKFVTGISKVSALVRSTEVVEHGDGSNTMPVKSPGRTMYEAITLERGRTSDTTFEEWANLVPGAPVNATGAAGAVFRKDVILDRSAGDVIQSVQLLAERV